MRSFMLEGLDADYDVDELVPVENTQEKVAETTEALPEMVYARSKMAVTLAILDAVADEELGGDVQAETPVDDTVPSDDTVTDAKWEQAKAAVDKITEAAITLRLVPSSIRGQVAAMMAKKLKQHNPQFALIRKAAAYLTDTLTEVPEEEIAKPATDAPEAAPAEVTETEDTSAAQTTAPEAPSVDEIVGEPTDENKVTVDNSIPDTAACALRRLAATTINERKAIARVSRTLSGPILQETLHQLRYQLPNKFIKRYNIG